MSQQRLLNTQDIAAQLKTLPQWTLNDGGKALKRDVTFQDFTTAFSVMTRIAFLAENMNHHPDWCNAYNHLSITLTTHDSGGVTEKDIKMARAISEMLD